MRSLLVACIALSLAGVRSFGQENYRGGIVYGPKAAFNISAPKGWVLDNKSGVEQGQPCVRYPKGSSRSDAKTLMYAKIASTQFETVNEFVAWPIKGMDEVHGKPKEIIATCKTSAGR